MGTTAEKLQKVLDTKNDIKAAIRETGTTVLDDETFASYPDKIRNNLVKPTGNVDITNTNSTDVSHAATAQIKDANSQIHKFTFSLFTKTPRFHIFTASIS